MAVLGSRKRLCTNSKVRDQDNIDEKCKLLINKKKQKEDICPQYENSPKIRAHPSLRKGGCHEVHDIEDLCKVGEMVEGCSYFAAQALAEAADIVFCPYSYILNPLIRNVMEIELKGNIIILDEAHNIEDMARQAASIDAEEGVLLQLLKELKNLCQSNRVALADQEQIYQPLYKMTEGIMSWIGQRRNTLRKCSSELYESWWTADNALKELQVASISKQCFPMLQVCATEAMEIAREGNPEVDYLSGRTCTLLEGLFTSLNYFFSDDGTHICDYLLVLQRDINGDAGLSADDDSSPCTVRLCSLNPALVFKNIADSALSVILTSGTLSPMSSFQSELGAQFGISLEAPPVINVDSQLWAGVIHSGPDNYPLNASYNTSDNPDFQDALGKSLEEICKVVPGGCLVFFPSYKLMNRLRRRWSQTGQWSRLNAEQPVFVEPRSQDEFEQVLNSYYASVCQNNKPMIGKKQGEKVDAKNCNSTKSKGNSRKGATFFAVCRGKVSEGIDFPDEKARAVILVGIPFANVTDIEIKGKRRYNDALKSSKGLNGNEWYCQQAFRALNQAAGRCIRHRLDYGAIIFLDERFCQQRHLGYISKWIRKSIREDDDFDQSLEGLMSFFEGIKVENHANSLQPTDAENNATSKSNEAVAPELATNISSFTCTTRKYDCSGLHTEPKCQEDRLANKRDNNTCIDSTGLESDLETPNSVKEMPVKETCPTTFESVFEGELSASTIIQTKFPDQQLPHSFSSPRPTSASECTHASVTPIKEHISQNGSPVYSSVNSHAHKRRKISASDLVRIEQFGPPSPKTPIMKFSVPQSSTLDTPGMSSSITCGDVMEKDLSISCSLCRNPVGLKENNYLVSCSLMSLPKVHLVSLWKGKLEKSAMGPISVPVVVSDISAVDRRIRERSPEGGIVQGIWSKEDGCVYDTIFCPFCSNQDHCLGLHVVATDKSNATFQDKVLFIEDRLEIQHITA